jgi:hypothetical protein
MVKLESYQEEEQPLKSEFGDEIGVRKRWGRDVLTE